jgi:hypothetical protein
LRRRARRSISAWWSHIDKRWDSIVPSFLIRNIGWRCLITLQVIHTSINISTDLIHPIMDLTVPILSRIIEIFLLEIFLSLFVLLLDMPTAIYPIATTICPILAISFLSIETIEFKPNCITGYKV